MDLFAQPAGVPLKEASSFIPAPGGAPANVAVALARLGLEVGFIGLVGDDPFGLLFTELLQGEGVDTTHFRRLAGSSTMLALVASDSPNEQDFIIYRGAAARLEAADLNRAYITSAEVFLYGAVTLSEASREAAFQAVTWANEAGVWVIFDANLRPALWPSPEAARQGILAGLQDAAVVKLNETELTLLVGTNDLPSGSRRVLGQGPKLCLVTLGSQGAYFNNGRVEGHVPAFQVNAVDTTGCGDAFLAGLTMGLLETGLPAEALDEATLRRLVRFANAAGALTATRRGAMAALPNRAAIDDFLKNYAGGTNMSDFEQMLRQAGVDTAAAAIGLDFALFTQVGMAERYHDHYWLVTHHPRLGAVINAVPSLDRTVSVPWEEWFRMDGELRHHVLYTVKQPESTDIWQGELDDQFHPPQVLGPLWHVYNDPEATPLLVR